jgi:hypothetical protein
MVGCAHSDNETLEQSRQENSIFKTFKNDLKCLFSKQGCTRKQKTRLLKQGSLLISTVLILSGIGYYVHWSGIKAIQARDEYLRDVEGIRTRANNLEGQLSGMMGPFGVYGPAGVTRILWLLECAGGYFGKRNYRNALSTLKQAEKFLAASEEYLAWLKILAHAQMRLKAGWVVWSPLSYFKVISPVYGVACHT